MVVSERHSPVTQIKEWDRSLRQGAPIDDLEHLVAQAVGIGGWAKLAKWLGLGQVRAGVRGIQPYEFVALPGSALFYLDCKHLTLETQVAQGLTRGLFVWGPSGLLYLSRRPESVGWLLDDEARPVNEYDPAQLARLVCDALAVRGNVTHVLVAVAEQLTSSEPLPGWGHKGDYELDRGAWAAVRRRWFAPRLVGGPHQYLLEFCTVSGHHHDKQRLSHLRYAISQDLGHYRQRAGGFRIEERSTELMCKKLFLSVPKVHC